MSNCFNLSRISDKLPILNAPRKFRRSILATDKEVEGYKKMVDKYERKQNKEQYGKYSIPLLAIASLVVSFLIAGSILAIIVY